MDNPISFKYNGRKVEIFFNREFTSRRVITTCTMNIHGMGVFSGSAICAPRDSDDREYGKRLAFKRARDAFLDRVFAINFDPGLRKKFHDDMRFFYRHEVEPELAPFPDKNQAEPDPVEIPAVVEAVDSNIQY